MQQVRIGLVGCVATKQAVPAPAEDLYISPLFVARRAYVEERCDRWYILSALYGLLEPNTVIAPYDFTLKQIRSSERRAWGSSILAALLRLEPEIEGTIFEFHAGAEYRQLTLCDGLRSLGATVSVPMRLRGVGTQIAAYRSMSRGEKAEGAAEQASGEVSAPARPMQFPPSRSSLLGYDALAGFLAAQESGIVRLGFSEIEQIMGRKLPPSARRHQAWWSNTVNGHSHARAWLSAGWQTSLPKLEEERVTFEKMGTASQLSRHALRPVEHGNSWGPGSPVQGPRSVGGARLDGLSKFLDGYQVDSVRLSFTEIEEIAGEALPGSARRHQSWWSNGPTNPYASIWRAAGWKTQLPRLNQESVVFVRDRKAALDLSASLENHEPQKVLRAAEPLADEIDRLYAIMEEMRARAGGFRLLRNCDGRMDWPLRGVYFFFEESERLPDARPRIVRVGTHAITERSSSTLWGRLSQHKGSFSRDTGMPGGNHRGSIFRRHVGDALLASTSGFEEALASWGVGASAAREVTRRERPLEAAVSALIGSMPLLWVGVDDAPSPASDRAVIERSCIALLSSDSTRRITPASPGWLGTYSKREQIRTSGLWNVDHIGASFDPAGIDALERWVRRM